MRKRFYLPMLALGYALSCHAVAEYSVTGNKAFQPSNPLTLWYLKPVTSETCSNPWMDYALPIGNGQLGAMLYGGIHCDEIQFNEKTLWEGSSTERGAYQNFGSLMIEDLGNDFASGATDYVRTLDISKAIGKATYSNKKGTVKYSAEYIASNPDKVIAVHLTADQPGSLSRRIYLKSAHGKTPIYTDTEGTFSGKLTTVSYQAQMMVVAKGGTATTSTNGISVTGADEITIYLAAATDYDPVASGYISGTANLAGKVSATLQNASSKGWNRVLADHETDYENLFSRVSLSLGSATKVSHFI